jgi:hypothetical protein
MPAPRPNRVTGNSGDAPQAGRAARSQARAASRACGPSRSWGDGRALRERPTDRDSAALEVHVAPFEAEGLAAAAAGREQEAEQGRESRLGRSVLLVPVAEGAHVLVLGNREQRLCFLPRPCFDHLHLGVLAAGHLGDQAADSVGRVLLNLAVANGKVEHAPNDREGVQDRGRLVPGLHLRPDVVQEVGLRDLAHVLGSEERLEVPLDQELARLLVPRRERHGVPGMPGAQLRAEGEGARRLGVWLERAERQGAVDLLGDLLGAALVGLRGADLLLALLRAGEVRPHPPCIAVPNDLRAHAQPLRRAR